MSQPARPNASASLVGASVVVFLGFLFATAFPARADEPDDVQYLLTTAVANLASPDPKVAADAQKQLLELGQISAPEIQKAMHRTGNPQVRRLGEEVLAKLESQFKITPTLVTLNLDNVQPEQAFEELSRAGGVRITGQWDFWRQRTPGLPQTVSVHFDKTPFVQALNELCGKTHLRLQQNWQPDYIMYPNYDQSARACPSYVAGPVLFRVVAISRSSWMDLSTMQESDSLTLQVETVVDPKIPLARVSPNMLVSEAVGDTGESLIDPKNGNSNDSWSWSGNPQLSVQQQVLLKFKTGNNKLIKTLKGSARLAIQSNPTTIEFTDLTAGKSITSGPWKLTLNTFSKTDDDYNVHLTAQNSTPVDRDEQSNLSGLTFCQLYDASGMPYI
ncbi:MAG TPA: hypothetical protein VG722_03970, partial [Tepidisphaeraceae bacterium]|nr:hypothetical protein [Tepidisphaeraceae bacterium]